MRQCFPPSLRVSGFLHLRPNLSNSTRLARLAPPSRPHFASELPLHWRRPLADTALPIRVCRLPNGLLGCLAQPREQRSANADVGRKGGTPGHGAPNCRRRARVAVLANARKGVELSSRNVYGGAVHRERDACTAKVARTSVAPSGLPKVRARVRLGSLAAALPRELTKALRS